MKHTVIALALMLSSLTVAQAQSGTDPGAETKILALEHAWNQAEERKDVKALDAILDDSIIYADTDGVLRTKEEFLARLQSSGQHLQQEVTHSMIAHMFGSTAVVSGLYIARGMEKGKPYVKRGRFIDTWVYKNGVWVCVGSQATPISH